MSSVKFVVLIRRQRQPSSSSEPSQCLSSCCLIFSQTHVVGLAIALNIVNFNDTYLIVQSDDIGAADVLALLRTLLAAADVGAPQHPEAARQLHDAARAAAEGLLAAAERETRHPRRRDALIADALRAAATVDGFSAEVGAADTPCLLALIMLCFHCVCMSCCRPSLHD
jgi:hypothetical protein